MLLAMIWVAMGILMQLILSIWYAHLDPQHHGRPLRLWGIKLPPVRLSAAVGVAMITAFLALIAAYQSHEEGRTTAQRWKSEEEHDAEARKSLELLQRDLTHATEMSTQLREAQESLLGQQDKTLEGTSHIKEETAAIAKAVTVAHRFLEEMRHSIGREEEALGAIAFPITALRAKWRVRQNLPQYARGVLEDALAATEHVRRVIGLSTA